MTRREDDSSGRHRPFLVSLVVLFLVYPVMTELGWMRFYWLAFVAALIMAVYTVGSTRKHLVIALALGVPTILAQGMAAAAPSREIILVGALLGLAFLIHVVVAVLRSVLAPGRVTTDKIAGAISVYLLLGLSFALVHGATAVMDPDSFQSSVGLLGGLQGDVDASAPFVFIYYSFVTVTSLGYGDISPTAPLSQTLSWIEAVFGQIYLATLIARLVAERIAWEGPENK